MREFFILAGGLLTIILVLYLILGFAVEMAIPHLSPQIEQTIAAGLLPHMAENNVDTIRSRKLQPLLDQLQKRCAVLPYHCKVKIIDSPRVNALALPGGAILIFSGLLDKLTSENELAFVLGHEMGHFVHRDHLRALGRGLAFLAISTTLFGPHNQITSLATKFVNLTELSFSRHQEAAADRYALEVLHCAYGHVEGALTFFKKLAAVQSSHANKVSFFSSHPLFPERIQNIKAYCRQQGFSCNR